MVRKCKILKTTSVGPLSPGFAGGEGWGEGAFDRDFNRDPFVRR